MAEAIYGGAALPVGSLGRNSVGWWGVLTLIATEASLFVYLLFTYYYFAAQHGKGWAPEPHPSLKLALPNTLILLTSSVAVWWGEGGVKRGRRGRQLGGLATGIALGVVFLVIQSFEWKAKTFGIKSGSYGSLFFIVTGFHMAHVIVGVIILFVVLTWSVAGYFNERRHAPVMISSAYWHFVDAVWVAVFFTFYVTPYLW
ncbi:MAG: cytochrome c oxidase subunit 3 [Candidatus Dormibacteria bacterium]